MKEFCEKILKRDAVVCVVGLGYVGLPLAISFVEAGFKVWGYDPDGEKIRDIKNGKSYLSHLDIEVCKMMVGNGQLVVTENADDLSKEIDIFIICVPTPLKQAGEPDLSYIEEVATLLSDFLDRKRLFVLESTTYPGTTEDFFIQALKYPSIQGNPVVGKDFFVAHSPERQDPANEQWNTTNIPKIVGGVTPECGALAHILYNQVIDKVIEVKDSKTAEMVKLTENIYRAVNIALVNELKMLCHKIDIDIFEVIEAAKTKPFGYQAFFPGPGWGGHCIPIDPFYLAWKAKSVGMCAKFIELAGEVNNSMPAYVVKRCQLALNMYKKSVADSRILVIGVAYKPDVNDLRESPALEIIKKLFYLDAKVYYHDPYIDKLTVNFQGGAVQWDSAKLSSKDISKFDLILIVTNHRVIDYKMIAENGRLVVDTRGVEELKNSMSEDKYVEA